MKRSAKRDRPARAQLGQFMTPPEIARSLVDQLKLERASRILEPSFGDGSFLIPLVERMVSIVGSFDQVMRENVFGVEMDRALFEKATQVLEDRWGPLPEGHQLQCADYFRWFPEPLWEGFDFIVGNPPFGGTFDPAIEDALDGKYGTFAGCKLKKETYSFFVAKGIEELAPSGRLRFICSDTFLTIKTMRGLRELLLESGRVVVEDLSTDFHETKQPMVVLDLERAERSSTAVIRGHQLSRKAMELTQNLSWGLRPEYLRYFDGPAIGSFMVATGGMTIGKNEWFIRRLEDDGTFEEPFAFEFFDRPITLELELAQARLNRLSAKLRERATAQEKAGATRRAVRAVPLPEPRRLQFPHPDYRPYNKASPEPVYDPPRHVIYWRDEGEAVLTFKKDGPWYLRGVGGRPFFEREGLTWQLVAPKINCRYLPPGFILDSGAPCAFLLEGTPRSELFVILAWLQTELATELLKSVINHTRNIQGKDVERLPYPHWVSAAERGAAGKLVEEAISRAMKGERPDPQLRKHLNKVFAWSDSSSLLAA